MDADINNHPEWGNSDPKRPILHVFFYMQMWWCDIGIPTTF